MFGRPASSSPSSAAAASSSSGEKVILGDTFKYPGSNIRITRDPIPFDPNHPELEYLEEKSKAAFTSGSDKLWLENNADFTFCDRHKRVAEMMKQHPDSHYETSCNKCLKQEYGGVLAAFFIPEKESLTIEQARTAWSMWQQRKPIEYRTLMQNPETNRARVKEFDFHERATWLRYHFLVWERNNYRVMAMRQSHARGEMTSEFLMLPTMADADLALFVRDADMRNAQTSAGMKGAKCNVRACDVHSELGNATVGHAIQTFNKSRYKLSCGICFLPRKTTQIQREMDACDDSSRVTDRPTFSFGPSSAAAAAAARR